MNQINGIDDISPPEPSVFARMYPKDAAAAKSKEEINKAGIGPEDVDFYWDNPE